MSDAREAVAAICIQGDEIPYRYYGKADKILAALRPIIAAEIREWADLGISVQLPPSDYEKGVTTVLNGLKSEADAIASRICGDQ